MTVAALFLLAAASMVSFDRQVKVPAADIRGLELTIRNRPGTLEMRYRVVQGEPKVRAVVLAKADQARFPGLRLLPGRFMVIHQAMGLASGRDPAALAYLTAFVEEMKASGFVAAALARHGIQGASVAPAR